MRLEKGIPVFEGNQIMIDGVEAEYTSVCRDCFMEERNKRKIKIRKI